MSHWVCGCHSENVSGGDKVQRFTMQQLSVATWRCGISLGLIREWMGHSGDNVGSLLTPAKRQPMERNVHFRVLLVSSQVAESIQAIIPVVMFLTCSVLIW